MSPGVPSIKRFTASRTMRHAPTAISAAMASESSGAMGSQPVSTWPASESRASEWEYKPPASSTRSTTSVSARARLRPDPGTTDFILPSATKFLSQDGVELEAGFTPAVTRRLYLERPTRHLAGGGFAGEDKRPSPRYLF